MKIYVDELPKNCKECGFCCKDDLGYWCQVFGDKTIYIADKTLKEKRLNTCPLETTHSLKQQVREEVADEIIARLSRIEDTLINCGNGKEDALAYFLKILRNVKGENNVKD